MPLLIFHFLAFPCDTHCPFHHCVLHIVIGRGVAQTHRYILNITNPTTFLYYQMMNDLSNNVCEVLKGYLVFFPHLWVSGTWRRGLFSLYLLRKKLPRLSVLLKTSIIPTVFPSSDLRGGKWADHTHTYTQKVNIVVRVFS